MDFSCAEFVALVKENRLEPIHLKQMKVLFGLLDKYWEGQYKQYAHGQLQDMHGTTLREVVSSFGTFMKTLAWLPAKDILMTSDTNGQVVLQEEEKLLEAEKLYLRAAIIQNLLGNTVAYLDAEPSNQSSFLQFIGVHTTITIEVVMDCLTKWCRRDDEAEHPEPAEFHTTLGHIKFLYNYLQENLPPKQLQDLLMSCPFIFVPKMADMTSVPVNVDHILICGRFLSRSEVRWTDPSGLFVKYKSSMQSSYLDSANKPSLKILYGQLRDFFIRNAKIDAKPSLEEYIELMVHIATSTTVSRGIHDVLAVFSMLGSELKAAAHTSTPEGDLLLSHMKGLPARLKTQKVIPTKGGRLVNVVYISQLVRIGQNIWSKYIYYQLNSFNGNYTW